MSPKTHSAGTGGPVARGVIARGTGNRRTRFRPVTQERDDHDNHYLPKLEGGKLSFKTSDLTPARAFERRQLDPTDHLFLSHQAFLSWLETRALSGEVDRELRNWSQRLYDAELRTDIERTERNRSLERKLVRMLGGGSRQATRHEVPYRKPPPGEWVIILGGSVGNFVVGLGRGAKHLGRYGVAVVEGDLDRLRELAEDDRDFVLLCLKLLTNLDVVASAMAVGIALYHKSDLDTRQAIKQGAMSFAGDFAINTYLSVKVKNLLLPWLRKRLKNGLLKRVLTKLKGHPVTVLSIAGFFEKAHAASRRLEREDVDVYNYLKKKGVHMSWFLVEDHVNKKIDAMDPELRRILLSR